MSTGTGTTTISTIATEDQNEGCNRNEKPSTNTLHLLSEFRNEKDIYQRYLKLAAHLDFLNLQETFLIEDQKNLKMELLRAQEEIKRIRSVPLVVGQFLEAIDENTGIVGSTTGSNSVIRILSTIDRELLKPSSSVALHRHSNALVDVLPPEADSTIRLLGELEKPSVSYGDIGGLDIQKQEIREAVELPLIQQELYSQIGIEPPRGVLLYGPPGTGKTLLVKAVAHHTKASFIRVVGSEFVQKYLGEVGFSIFFIFNRVLEWYEMYFALQRKMRHVLCLLTRLMLLLLSGLMHKPVRTERFNVFYLNF